MERMTAMNIVTALNVPRELMEAKVLGRLHV
jgi:hypothetical protein